jgi:hypothetical protein
MNTIVPTFVRPVADLFNSLVVDQNLKELLSFKGNYIIIQKFAFFKKQHNLYSCK